MQSISSEIISSSERGEGNEESDPAAVDYSEVARLRYVRDPKLEKEIRYSREGIDSHPSNDTDKESEIDSEAESLDSFQNSLRQWKSDDISSAFAASFPTDNTVVNPLKKWRQMKLNNLEKNLDLISVTEDDEEEEQDPSVSHSGSRMSDSMGSSIEKHPALQQMRESETSELTFGDSHEHLENSLNQDTNESKSKIPKPIKMFEKAIKSTAYLTKPATEKQKADSAGKKPTLLNRIYNLTKKTEKVKLFHDEEPGEFEKDPIALQEIKRFNQKYKVLHQIGTGGHSTVRLASKISDSSNVVAKFIHSSNVWHWEREGKEKIPLEISMMRKFAHTRLSNVIKYIEHFEIGERYIIIMEFLGQDWIDLYDFIELEGPVKEKIAKHIFQAVCETVQTMHKLGFSHNDIKDENIMINKKTLEIKLIDFGSTMPLTGQPTTVFYGTQKFSSPEALGNQPYNLPEQEVWALGTLLYVILFKMDPFADDDEIQTLNLSKRIEALRTSPYGKNFPPIDITDEAAESILMMLNKYPEDRPTIQDLLELPLFENITRM